MQAQVMDLNNAGISACLVGSAQHDRNILTRIGNGDFDIVYSSPEYLTTDNGKILLNTLKGHLTLVAIDGESIQP